MGGIWQNTPVPGHIVGISHWYLVSCSKNLKGLCFPKGQKTQRSDSSLNKLTFVTDERTKLSEAVVSPLKNRSDNKIKRDQSRACSVYYAGSPSTTGGGGGRGGGGRGGVARMIMSSVCPPGWWWQCGSTIWCRTSTLIRHSKIN